MAQRIFIAGDQLLVSHLHGVLQRAGIDVLMQKSVVDLPLEESGPLGWHAELWILRDCQLDTAARLLERALANESPQSHLLHHLDTQQPQTGGEGARHQLAQL